MMAWRRVLFIFNMACRNVYGLKLVYVISFLLISKTVITYEAMFLEKYETRICLETDTPSSY